MAECLYVLARKRDEDEDYTPQIAYDEVKGNLEEGDELRLSYDGYIYGFDEAGDIDFFDGAKNPDEILKAAENWLEPYATELADHLLKIVSDAGSDLSADGFRDKLKTAAANYGDGYKFYKAVNQLFGYPDFGVRQLFIDEYGSVEVRPSDHALAEIRANPANYYVLYIPYRG